MQDLSQQGAELRFKPGLSDSETSFSSSTSCLSKKRKNPRAAEGVLERISEIQAYVRMSVTP